MKEIIIVTGGSNGLGQAIVEYSLDKDLFACNLDKEPSKVKNRNYKEFIGDIADEKFIEESIKEISTLGNIKYLINNAGEPSFKLPTEYNKSDIDKCFKGLQGMILTSTNTLRVKQEQDLKIVNIMSSAALRGNKQEAVYCVTKWGERGYTERCNHN